MEEGKDINVNKRLKVKTMRVIFARIDWINTRRAVIGVLLLNDRESVTGTRLQLLMKSWKVVASGASGPYLSKRRVRGLPIVGQEVVFCVSDRWSTPRNGGITPVDWGMRSEWTAGGVTVQVEDQPQFSQQYWGNGSIAQTG